MVGQIISNTNTIKEQNNTRNVIYDYTNNLNVTNKTIAIIFVYKIGLTIIIGILQ